mgnify:CR=1 FL=1
MTDNYIHAVEPGLNNEHFRIYDIPRVRLPRGFIPAEILLEELIMPDIGTIESLSGDFVYWMKREENRSNYSYALRHAISRLNGRLSRIPLNQLTSKHRRDKMLYRSLALISCLLGAVAIGVSLFHYELIWYTPPVALIGYTAGILIFVIAAREVLLD